MRSIVSIAAFALFVTLFQACAPAPEAGPTPDQIRAEVQARSAAAVAAEKAKDWEAAVEFFSPDAVVQPANAPQIQGREAIRRLYDTFEAMVDFEGTTTAIVPAASGDMAYEYGVNWLVFETPEGNVEDLGKYLLVWTKSEGEWFIDALSFSSDAAPQG